jgi:hypothetical protein
LKKRMTETFVERFKPVAGKQFDVFDEGRPGLILRISWGGAKTFRIRYKDDKGKTRTYKLGRWHPVDFNLKAAWDAARKFDFAAVKSAKTKVAPTTALESEGKTPKFQLTFASVIEKYISEIVVDFRTSKETARCLRKYAVPAFGDRIFREIEAYEVKALRKTMIKDNGPRQADIVFGLIRTVMFWVEDDDYNKGIYTCPLKYSPRRRKRKAGRSRGGRDRVPLHLRRVHHALLA